jgi:hypothetical protein
MPTCILDMDYILFSNFVDSECLLWTWDYVQVSSFVDSDLYAYMYCGHGLHTSYQFCGFGMPIMDMDPTLLAGTCRNVQIAIRLNVFTVHILSAPLLISSLY